MFEAFILGIVQGFSELLPISSSAHLIVVPWLFGWQDQGLAFDVALHWATLLAVALYFRKDVLLLAKGFYKSLFKKTRNFSGEVYQKLAWILVIATIPAGIVGKLLERWVSGSFRNPVLIVFTVSVFGLVLFFAEKFSKREKSLEKISFKDGLLVGLAQCFALVPGVSRSGSTITAGLFLGLDRQTSARFSFLLALPITLGAGLLEFGKIADLGNSGSFESLAVGFFTAFVCALLAIKYLLVYVQKKDYKVFVWYRLVFAFVVLGVYLLR